MYASSTHWWNQSMSIFLPGASLTLGWPIRDNALQKKAFVPYLVYTLVKAWSLKLNERTHGKQQPT